MSRRRLDVGGDCDVRLLPLRVAGLTGCGIDALHAHDSRRCGPTRRGDPDDIGSCERRRVRRPAERARAGGDRDALLKEDLPFVIRAVDLKRGKAGGGRRVANPRRVAVAVAVRADRRQIRAVAGEGPSAVPDLEGAARCPLGTGHRKGEHEQD